MGSRLIGRGTPHDISLPAKVDLSARQFTFVKFASVTGSQTAYIDAAGAGDRGWILQDDPIANKAGRIRLEGTSALKVDGNAGAIAVGDALKSDTNGLGIKATAASAFNAIALEPSTSATDIIEVLVVHGYLPA